MSPSKFINELGQPIGFPVTDWVECRWPPRTPMSGQFGAVTPLDVKAHATDLFDALNEDTDGRNWTYLPYGPFRSFEEFSNWLVSECTQADPFFHSIINVETGKVMGLASYLRIQPTMGLIEVGHIHFSPRLQRTPAATEAMFMMMSRAFEELGYRRYEWKCDALNQRSRNAATRLGFTFEGIFRQAAIYKGRSRDTAWFSITDQEWPAIKSAFKEWLAPQNFDDNSVQRQRLSTLITAKQSQTTVDERGMSGTGPKYIDQLLPRADQVGADFEG